MPTLRIYSWMNPFVSLGYSQRATAVLNIDDCYRKKIGIVRRITGGAAIFHHYELTYSLVCSREDLDLPGKIKDSYKILNNFLLDFYRHLGIEACFAGDILKDKNSGADNFCFFGREQFDIIAGGKKIGGNAQRISKDVIFQHGSIPARLDWEIIFKLIKGLNRDTLTRAASLDVLVNDELCYSYLCDILKDSFAKRFGIKFNLGDLDIEERGCLEQLMENKYLSQSWNFNDDAKAMVG